MKQEHEWFCGHMLDEDERALGRRTILPLFVWAVVIGLVVGLVMYAGGARAEAIYKGQNEGVVLTLYSEDCKLKDQITNLSKRITWEEKGATYEGCFALHQAGFVVAYFTDKTVAVIPADLFAKVSGV